MIIPTSDPSSVLFVRLNSSIGAVQHSSSHPLSYLIDLRSIANAIFEMLVDRPNLHPIYHQVRFKWMGRSCDLSHSPNFSPRPPEWHTLSLRSVDWGSFGFRSDAYISEKWLRYFHKHCMNARNSHARFAVCNWLPFMITMT